MCVSAAMNVLFDTTCFAVSHQHIKPVLSLKLCRVRRHTQSMPLHMLVKFVFMVLLASRGNAFLCAPSNSIATCGALGDVWTSMGGSEWKNTTGWATAAAGACSWLGVRMWAGSGVCYLPTRLPTPIRIRNRFLLVLWRRLLCRRHHVAQPAQQQPFWPNAHHCQ